jgi:hypothetical protein
MKHLYWIGTDKRIEHSAECWCRGDRLFHIGMLAHGRVYLWLDGSL